LQKFHTNRCAETREDYEQNLYKSDVINNIIHCIQNSFYLKLLRLLPDRRMVRSIMELVDKIATSPLPPLTANGIGYHASWLASYRDPDWHPFSSTSPPLTSSQASNLLSFVAKEPHCL